MKKKILIGSIIAVVLLTLVSFSSVVGKVSSDEEFVEIVTEETDCGCEDESSPIGWNFPILCTLLIPLVVIGILIAIQTSQTGFIDFINLIVDTIGCSWA